nr:hypothetical protein Itr_chr01CG18700 [Ipomoea trifida]
MGNLFFFRIYHLFFSDLRYWRRLAAPIDAGDRSATAGVTIGAAMATTAVRLFDPLDLLHAAAALVCDRFCTRRRGDLADGGAVSQAAD